ncbi:MAG: EFR1 family ferrodoxin [archaeon]|nr:EFR1 family ferrodoxin [archaeon]
MIIYFSGTGNSRYVAEGLSQILDDKLVSASDLMKVKDKETFNSEKPFVFVGPVYAWRLPKVFRKFIRESIFLGPRNAYVVVTCGLSPADTYGSIKADLKRVGLNVKGFSYIKMPANYIAMYNPPNKEKSKEIVKNGHNKVIEIGEKIKNGESFIDSPSNAKSKFLSIFAYQFSNLMFRSKKFKVSEDCVGCGSCALLCPFESIQIINNKPSWNGKCTHCMACISVCPTQAIDYGEKTKGRNRYFLKDKF